MTPSPTQTAIDWNRRAIRRAEGRKRRAGKDTERRDAERDIERYQANIRQLEGKAR